MAEAENFWDSGVKSYLRMAIGSWVVLKVYPKTGKVLVQGVNIVKKHQKPNRANAQGGIIEKEGAIYSSKVMLYCTKCKNATRISNKILEDGTKVRVCKKCGETF